MKELRSKAVIVLVNSKTGDFQKMPRPVQEALSKPEMGSLIPRMSVFDKESENIIGSLAYKQLSDKKAFRALEKAIQEYAKSGKAPGGEDSGDDASTPGEVAEGTSATDTDSESGSETGDGVGVAQDREISDNSLYEWTSTKGTKITARATAYVGGKLTLVRENGSSVSVGLDQLDDESRKIAEELIGE